MPRLQELEHEKQTYSISNQDLRRNIGDRDATAEQLLNKVMTLQLKLEEKMFAESMMARARQRSRSRIVAPVRSEKKSLWKRVFGQEKEQVGDEDEDDSDPARGPPATEAAAARAEVVGGVVRKLSARATGAAPGRRLACCRRGH